MKEKRVKIQSHQSRVAAMRDRLRAAIKEVRKAQKLASKTAFYCEASLDGLIYELELNVGYLEAHIDDGILEGDIIEGAA